jgi:hypothetical protein
MVHDPASCSEPQGGAATTTAGLQIADIFRVHGDAYRREHRLSTEQRCAMRSIEVCRTAALGGHLDVCDRCGFERPSYNSCRNRHCPKCQSLAQARWIQERKQRILPTHYFHVVFTLPATLRALALANRRVVFSLLFQAAAQTLLTLGRDPKRLGGMLGITAVLHTWTRALKLHPHLHCVVSGGALSADGQRWLPTKNQRYLFPVRLLSTLFRAKFLRALRRAFVGGKLRFPSRIANLAEPRAFHCFMDSLYHQDWVVYAKRPFGGAEHVFEYLGRYTHRVAISNQRLKAIDHNSVCFHTRDGKTVTLNPTEFIRRFLLHVLPAGFTKIRHYGLFAPASVCNALQRAHALLGDPLAVHAPDSAAAQTDWRAQLVALSGVDLLRCPRCELGSMVRHPLPHALMAIPDG